MLHNMDQELAGPHTFDDRAQGPCAHQNKGNRDQFGHTVDKGIERLGHAEELGAYTHDARTHRATHKGDANSKCNVGIAEASHQPVVNQIAGPENGGKERTKQASNRDDKVPHSKLIICGQFIFHLWNQGLNPVIQQLSGLSGPLFFLVHRAKVQAESSNDQNRNHGKYAIQIERKHIQPDAPFVALNAACQQLCGNQSRDKGTIAANGRKRS